MCDDATYRTSAIFDLTKYSGSGNIDTFLTLIQTTQNETSLIEINHSKIIHSTNDHNLSYSQTPAKLFFSRFFFTQLTTQ